VNRFIEAQSSACTGFSKALNELKSGRKTSHWMWYIFPQLRGLGVSELSYIYGILDLDEAREYLKNETLGARLIEIVTVVLKLDTKNAVEIFGWIDSMKLRSCLTLFALASDEENNVFEKALQKYFDGIQDERTIAMLNTKQ
jgi:uncharacterized protein (DUF1810 family)